MRTSKDRVLRLLRDNQLLSPARQPEPGRSNPHEGTIVTAAPDRMWGTDATATGTELDGGVIVFGPVSDPNDAWGIAILEVENESDVRAITNNDPVVKSGLGFRYELYRMPQLITR